MGYLKPITSSSLDRLSGDLLQLANSGPLMPPDGSMQGACAQQAHILKTSGLESNPWVSIDLQGVFNITAVLIWLPRDGTSVTPALRVVVTDTPAAQLSLSGRQQLAPAPCGVSAPSTSGQLMVPVQCASKMGRYVTVQLAAPAVPPTPLRLCSISVIGGRLLPKPLMCVPMRCLA